MERVTTSVSSCMGKSLSKSYFATNELSLMDIRLWGNPNHFQYLASAIRDRYDQSVLQILIAKRNSGTFTYDGIETGGERVAREIEDAIEEYARDGVQIKKLSIVGYSLGGLLGTLCGDRLIVIL